MPAVGMRDFTRRLFQHCPMLVSFEGKVEEYIKGFSQYKMGVPVYGCIILDPSLSTACSSRWGICTCTHLHTHACTCVSHLYSSYLPGNIVSAINRYTNVRVWPLKYILKYLEKRIEKIQIQFCMALYTLPHKYSHTCTFTFNSLAEARSKDDTGMYVRT